MPDLIIKGIEMPESCYVCYANNGSYCFAVPDGADDYVGPYYKARSGRPDWCPLRPVPEWIKFTTREPDAEEREMHPDWEYVLNCQLPDDGQRILVLVKYSAHEKVQMDEFCYDTDGCYLDSGYDLVSEVTHWMPLPEPPKGGDGDG